MDSEHGAASSPESAPLNTQATANQGAGSYASTGDDSAASPGAAPQKPSWKDFDFTQVDPHELISHVPGLQGVIGNLTQKQAQKLARQMTDEERERQAQQAAIQRAKEAREEKRRLAREDPDRLAEMVAQEVTQEEYNEWQRDLRKSMQAEFTGYLASEVQAFYDDPDVQSVMKDADRETLEKLDWRNYNGLNPWLRSATKIISEKRAEQRAQELVKARSKAADKESVVDGAQNDARDGVDLGLAGGVPGGRIFTKADLATMSLDEYRKYKKIIAVQEREGRLR